jgi:hypothetical protein
VTFVAQPDPAPCTPNPSLAPMGEVTV